MPADYLIAPWIDALCDVWKTVQIDGFKTVKSPYLVKEKKFPSTISPSSDFPIALTIPDLTGPQYSVGGPKEGFITGVTEFHVSPDVQKARLPELIMWPGAILKAAAANMQLGGLVTHFIIPQERGIVGPLALQYGDEQEHWGFIVNWEVKTKSLHASVIVTS